MLFLKPSKFNQPQPTTPPVPPEQASKNNGIYINAAMRSIRVDLYDHGTPASLEQCLGTLEVAKDVVKQTLTVWHAREAQRSGAIIIPRVEGHA